MDKEYLYIGMFPKLDARVRKYVREVTHRSALIIINISWQYTYL
jgi:hypothetical protein